ncbi:MAG: phosphate ABC transporter permease subunit PstC [Geminicoccaceae bacterium]
MSQTLVIPFLLVLAAIGYWLGRQRALALRDGTATGGLATLPQYYGYYVALIAGLPALALFLAGLLFQGTIVDSLLLGSLPPEMTTDITSAERNLLLSSIRNAAAGATFGTPEPAILAAAETLNTYRLIVNGAVLALVMALAIAGLTWARSRIAPRFRARHRVEAIIFGLMVLCSLIAILTTLGILVSLVFESLRFFARVPVTEFLFGTKWDPQIAIRADQVGGSGAFGAVPIFWGTIVVSVCAMAVAVPIGLMAAIYTAEYATPLARGTIKPILEILAGIPTIVYGFFAVITVSPFLRGLAAAMGIEMAPTAAIVAGGVMGIMLIPFISSFADDALNAVPRSLRDGAAALGATKSETIRQVLLPAALPGIMGGVLLAVSRAIGETMIVVMAAGLTANLTLNPLEGVTTTTVQIVALLTGDTEFDSPKTLAAFGLGLVLFTATLLLNVLALRIVKKYREQYD